MTTETTSYWSGNRKYQKLYERLHALVPVEGSVPNARTTNRALEKLRKASNCYYDLFNNGLCNRAAEFRQVFGFGGKFIAEHHFMHCEKLEQKVDEIVLAAAREQNIPIEE